MNNFKLLSFALAATVGAGSAAWAQVDAAGFARCRTLTDGAARLACYDALVQPIAQAATSPKPAAEAFGLPSEADKSQSVASQINGKFEGWDGNVDITLANGHVWRITDGSRAYVNLMNPKVTVERGVLGAFYLRIDGMNQSPRVRRVK